MLYPQVGAEQAVDDFRMDFCDLIVSMEQAEINPRRWLGRSSWRAGLACPSFCGCLYVHHASADFAGAGCFLPALNALLNGLCAISLCLGLYFIKHHNRGAHRTSMLLAFAFSSISHQLHREPRTARRHDFPGHGRCARCIFPFSQSRNSFHRRATDGANDVFFLADGPVRNAPRIARLTSPFGSTFRSPAWVVFVFLKAYAY